MRIKMFNWTTNYLMLLGSEQLDPQHFIFLDPQIYADSRIQVWKKEWRKKEHFDEMNKKENIFYGLTLSVNTYLCARIGSESTLEYNSRSQSCSSRRSSRSFSTSFPGYSLRLTKFLSIGIYLFKKRFCSQ